MIPDTSLMSTNRASPPRQYLTDACHRCFGQNSSRLCHPELSTSIRTFRFWSLKKVNKARRGHPSVLEAVVYGQAVSVEFLKGPRILVSVSWEPFAFAHTRKVVLVLFTFMPRTCLFAFWPNIHVAEIYSAPKNLKIFLATSAPNFSKNHKISIRAQNSPKNKCIFSPLSLGLCLHCL